MGKKFITLTFADWLTYKKLKRSSPTEITMNKSIC